MVYLQQPNKKIKEYKPQYNKEKIKSNKYYENPKKSSYKKHIYISKKSKYNKKDITCQKCGKKWHYKNECILKAKVKNYKYLLKIKIKYLKYSN